MKNIKYIFIGNSQTLKDIGDYPPKTSDKWVKDTRQIFEKYCKAQSDKYDQRNRVVGEDGNYYFTISQTNIFYIVLATAEYPERNIFELIEEIQKENVPLLTDEKGELNKIGKQSLKNLIESYQNPASNKIQMVQDDLEGVKVEVRDGIKKVMTNLEDVNVLDQRANRINEGAKAFKKDATTLKRITCWQNCKWTIIISILIIGILLVIIIPLATSGKKSDSNTNTNTNSTTSNRMLFLSDD